MSASKKNGSDAIHRARRQTDGSFSCTAAVLGYAFSPPIAVGILELPQGVVLQYINVLLKPPLIAQHCPRIIQYPENSKPFILRLSLQRTVGNKARDLVLRARSIYRRDHCPSEAGVRQILWRIAEIKGYRPRYPA
jgi:hypothetical protein